MKATVVGAALLFTAVSLSAAIRGTAVTPDGVPVPSVTVKVYASLPRVERDAKLLAGETIEPVATAQTGDKGTFVVEVPREGNYIAQLTAPGYAPASFRTNGMEDVAGIALRAAPPKGGRVTANGAPVANATLLFTSDSGAMLVVRSDEEGKYSIPDPAQWRPGVTVVHPHFTRLTVPSISPRRPIDLDLKLHPGVALRGRVVSTDGKNGAKAQLAVDGIPFGESNDDGTFALAHVPGNWRELRATSGSLAAQAGRGNAETLRLAPALAFSGSVVDAKTRVPLAGANVILRATAFSSDALAEAVTDEKGRFTIAPLLAGNAVLNVSSAGYVSSVGPQSITASMAPKTIYLRRDARISGRIVDEERHPVAGARVTFSRPNVYFASEDLTRVSAPDGRYAYRLLSADGGDLTLVATKRGYANAAVHGQKFVSGDDKRVDFELTRGIPVSGQVFDADGNPVRDVAVTASEVTEPRFNAPAPDSRDALRTDAEGKFVLQLRPATYNLYYAADGFVPKVMKQVKVEAAMEPLRVDLQRAVAIRGRVVYDDGEPGASLDVYAYVDGFPAETRTDATGAFVLDGLPPKSLSVSVSSEDGAVMEDRRVTAPADDVLIELTPAVRVSGRVLAAANQRAVTDYQIEIRAPQQGGGAYYGGLSTERSVHDSEGKFVLERVFVRPAELVVSAPGFTPSTVALALEKGKNLSDLEVTLAPGSRVSGRVTTQTGAPADRVRVSWAGADRSGWSSEDAIFTDANGEYAIDGIPYGEATLLFNKSGLVPARKTVTVDAADTRVDVQLAAGKSLPGRVVMDDGTPVSGARINAYSPGGMAGVSSAMSDEAGRFTLEGLASAVYRVTAEKRGIPVLNLPEVDVAQLSELTLTFPTGAVITGRILGLAPEQYPNVMIAASDPVAQASAMGSPDANGNYRIEGAPIGNIRVRAVLRGGDRSRASEFVDLVTQARGSYKADLEFLEHNTLRGRVTRYGVPVRGGTIIFVPKVPPRNGGSASIADDGQYEVQGVRSGEATVIVTSFAENYRYVTTANVTRSGTMDFDLKPATLTGMVVDDASDQPLAGAAIVLEPADPSVEEFGNPSGKTGADGRFVIANVAPGTYRLQASQEGYANQVLERTIGEGANVDVTLRLTPAAGVTLRLTDARTGQPIGAMVTAYGDDGSIVWQGSPQLKGDGSSRLPLAPGRYRASISLWGMGTIYTTLTSPGTQSASLRAGSRVQVENGSSVAYRSIVLAADGSVYDATPYTATPETLLGPGTTWLPDFAAGTYTLQLLDSRGAVAKSIPFVVREGEITRVDL